MTALEDQVATLGGGWAHRATPPRRFDILCPVQEGSHAQWKQWERDTPHPGYPDAGRAPDADGELLPLI